VQTALDIVSPMYGRADDQAWNRKLIEGARAPGNWHTALILGKCASTSYGYSCAEVSYLPERFFGIGQGLLTDGQWMAFRASRVVVNELEKK
jgi:hypothetical protein